MKAIRQLKSDLDTPTIMSSNDKGNIVLDNITIDILNNKSFSNLNIEKEAIKASCMEDVRRAELKSKLEKHIGHDGIKKWLYDSTIFYIEHEEEYKTACIPGNKGILLFGISGTGKTTLAKEICQDLIKAFGDKILCIEINFHDFAAHRVGEASEKITEYFNELKADNRFKIIIMDEMESLAPERGSAGVLALERTDSMLKNIDELPRTFIIGISNHKEKIDKAMLREGRLGESCEVYPPTEEDKKIFVELWLNNGSIQYEPNVNLHALSVYDGMVGADFRYLQNRLFTLYLKNGKKPLSISDVGMINSNLTAKLRARGISTNCVKVSSRPIENNELSKTPIGSNDTFTKLNQGITMEDARLSDFKRRVEESKKTPVSQINHSEV